MANEQLALYDVPPIPPKQENKQKKSWEDGFQKWSNESAQDEGNEGNPLGICGYGSMCDYCADNTYGRPCVRALNEMCREKRITIDYSKRNYADIWEGVF